MKFKSVLMSALSVVSASGAPLEIGAELPKLLGTNQDGQEVVIKSADGHQWLVIFTYPKALTGG